MKRFIVALLLVSAAMASYSTWTQDSQAEFEEGAPHSIPYTNATVDATGVQLMGYRNIRLTEDGAESQWSSIDTDSDGDVHIAWDDGRDGNHEIYYKKLSGTDGTNITDDIRVTTAAGSSYTVSLRVDTSGDAHIAWEGSRTSPLAPQTTLTETASAARRKVCTAQTPTTQTPTATGSTTAKKSCSAATRSTPGACQRPRQAPSTWRPRSTQ
jgi:hypothetical protein